LWSEGSESYYCNTIPSPDGGTHEAGLRAALTKGIRAFGELVGNKKAKDITADDVMNGVELMLSVFIRNPHFQSQTKDRLTSLEAARFVEAAVRDHFDHFLADNMDRGRALLGTILERMDERLKRRAEREVQRKTATSARKLRLPGKLTDCSSDDPQGTELFIVDGDGAHIATLLMTFFFQEMPELVRRGHLFLAQPPLYRLTAGAKTLYARDDAHRAELEASEFKGKKVDVSRFKGLGEMNPNQLKETTMDPGSRSLLKVTLPGPYEERQAARDIVERLMGRDPALRFEFIQQRASALDGEAIDA